LSLLFVYFLVLRVRRRRPGRRERGKKGGLNHRCSLDRSLTLLLLLLLLYILPPPLLQLRKAPRGNDLMNEISDKIKSGAKAFLKKEYYYLCYYAVAVFAVLLVLYTLVPPSGYRTDGIRFACCFLCGALLSAGSGWAGMMVATDANVKTAQAASEHGLNTALRVAFTGGAVMGFTVVGLGLAGLSVMYYLMTLGYPGDEVTFYQRLSWAAEIIPGFGFGASSIAIFARVAGGIYTKAADVGADLVGKVEMDIPEDDPRNPAVIADNVGDNVGDVAGMGADLFESYVSALWCWLALSLARLLSLALLLVVF
jgi:Na+/H+-translocating membrane pyrophosphatase